MTAWPYPRVTVFVSSTLGECAPERSAARKAIEAIKCDPVFFETIGARPHPARITYLEGLSRSQICVIIWKESYGYVDPAVGISGIEDEFRVARERDMDILLYIKEDAPNRDTRLTSLINEARTFLKTQNYQTEADLQDQVSSDITSVVSAAYLDRITPRAERLIDPSAVLTGTMPAGTTALNRPQLEQQIDTSVAQKSITWLTGEPGAGKTVLLAQWSIRHRAAYVNARDLSLRHLLQAIVTALSGTPLAEDAITLEDAIQALRAAWQKNARWPLAIDDPSDIPELLRVIADLGPADESARLIIGTRTVADASNDGIVNVPGLTSTEAAAIIRQLPGAIRDTVTSRTSTMTGVLPLAIRREAAAQQSPQYLVFDETGEVDSNPTTRELLAFIIASPEPLTLDDLIELSSAGDSPVTLDSHLTSISFLLIDDGLGYRPVHDEISRELRLALSRRPALERFVSQRLAQFFAKARRYLAAFNLYRSFDQPKALRAAYRAAMQATQEGRFALGIPPLQFIADNKRVSGERLDLVIALISLSQAEDTVGRTEGANTTLDEAESIAREVGDPDLLQTVADQKLIKRVRHQLRPDDLAALRAVRQRYAEAGRIADSARLAVEEGAILISIGDHENAVLVLREALTGFQKTGDNYGVYIASRNLIAALNMVDGGQLEAERLLQSLQDGGAYRNQQRERAWMCNILARRYRLNNRLDDAIEAAQEAISLGGQLNDPYVIALNRIGLGNALREKGDLSGALEQFQECGKEAQSIDRKEIDGLASRLASSVLVQQAEEGAPYLRPKLYGEAEAFATHVIGLLRGSIAEVQVAEAFDSRGDARLGLGRKTEALADYAESSKLFFGFDEDRALRLLHFLARNCDIDQPLETMNVMLSAIPNGALPASDDPWIRLIALIEESVIKGHPEATSLYARTALKLSQTIVSETLEVGLWMRLLTIALEDKAPPDDGRLAFLLSAFLAHTRARRLSLTQLTALTDLTLGKSKAIHFHSVANHLQTSLTIGPDDKILIVFDDIDGTPATRFCSTALACFFSAFRKDIDQVFFSSPITTGIFVRCSIVDMADAPEDIRAMLEGNEVPGPVAVAMFEHATNGLSGLFIACREDLQERCQGDPMKATELQYMYADVLRAVIAVALGGDIEAEVLRPKIVSIIRKTIQ
ncbi:tetratricopeptide (TPR) repeat protein [Nitrobacteraceae bacterium AZCC 2146]